MNDKLWFARLALSDGSAHNLHLAIFRCGLGRVLYIRKFDLVSTALGEFRAIPLFRF